MQFPRYATPLFILQSHQSGGKLLQLYSARSHYLLQVRLRAHQRLFGSLVSLNLLRAFLSCHSLLSHACIILRAPAANSASPVIKRASSQSNLHSSSCDQIQSFRFFVSHVNGDDLPFDNPNTDAVQIFESSRRF